MITALIGSHGTGKSTVFEELKPHIPEANFFTEGVRHQTPSFGYDNPYQLIGKFGVGAFELVNINSWSVIDPGVNSLLSKTDVVITDRSAVDNYAYFLTLAASEEDLKLLPLIRNMARHYASLVDKYIYFPTGNIELVGDDMRPSDIEYQERVASNIELALDELGVPESKVHQLGSIIVSERVKEVLRVISE